MQRNEVDRLLSQLVALGGSDLHLKAGARPRVRVGGELRTLDTEAPLDGASLLDAAGAVMPERTRAAFEERPEADFAYVATALGRFRVNAFRQRGSVGMVFRHVRPGTPSLSELAHPEVVRQLAEETGGIVLVTGPTGSGKTTTLAAMIDHINATRPCHIITIEDPIEVLHEDRLAAIDQREVGFDTESFSVALRSALRQDPDVILVGEMRDAETVVTALTAAETGHLVLSTLHTGDAVETVNRIVDLFPASQQRQTRLSLAAALRGTICQRLVPLASGAGRVAALEVLVANGRIRQCIVDPDQTAGIAEIIAEGGSYGMRTFAASLTELLRSGQIELDTALANAPSPHDLRIALEREGLAGRGVGPLTAA